MLDPMTWLEAFTDLATLKSGQWLSGSVLDYWLQTFWIMLGKPPFRYIPTRYLLPTNTAPNATEIMHFRRLFDLPTQASCPPEPVIGIVNTGQNPNKGGNHYCVMMFLPETNIVHVVGRLYTQNSIIPNSRNWGEWSGDNIWSNIAHLHGWPVSSPTVHEVNWLQNGFDCGAIAVQVIETIWTDGLHTHGNGPWKLPSLPCCHTTRKRVATGINTAIADTIPLFHQATAGVHAAQLDDGVNGFFLGLEQSKTSVNDALVRGGLRNHHQVANAVVRDLSKAMLSCAACHELLPGDLRRVLLGDGKPSVLPKGARIKETHVQHEPRFSTTPPPLASEDESEGKQDAPPHVGKTKPSTSRSTDFSQAKASRFLRPIQSTHLPPLGSRLGLRIPFDLSFDDYTNGPTLETLDPIPDTIAKLASLSLSYIANQIILCPWTMYKDYGYRLEPDFGQGFHLCDPVLVEKHLMPVGLSAPPLSGVQLTEHWDMVVMGAREMIAAADKDRTDDLFVTGKTTDGSYIRVDLTRDEVKPCSISRSCDIDSLIWITQAPRFLKSIQVFTKPVIRPRAPISKHNHVYVDVLLPQSEHDREAGGLRREWYSQKFRLSRIPHVQFARIGEGSGAGELLLFFPRMIHQQPYTGYWAAQVPSDVQNLFWDRVLMPAVRQVVPDMDHPYVDHDRSHLAFKERGTKTHHHPFHPDTFSNLIEQMHTKV